MHKNTRADAALYANLVNKQWVRLLDSLGMNVPYTRCEGTKLWVEGGDCYTDFLSGYCVHNVGHNHPDVIRALHDELDKRGAVIVQSHVPGLAGRLASKLCSLAGGQLTRAWFANTGSEGVETAIKYSRLHTKRSGILYSLGAFHGISYGAMSLMKNTDWAEDGFGPFLEDTQGIPFLDLEELERHLRTKEYAAFITEAVQGEMGVVLPPADQLVKAQELCRAYGTLFVVDEVQTGMFRTGTFLASHQLGVQPDIVILAKALSGGVMPVGAVLMSEAIWGSVYHALDRAFVNSSTFGENALSMRAGLETLDIMERENLGQRAQELGHLLRERVNDLVPRYEMLKEVRGLGLMNGVEFCPPKSLKLKLLFKGFRLAHPGLFGQMLVRMMFKNKVLTQVSGNNHMVLKACPPLTATEEDIETFVDALDKSLQSFHSGAGFVEGLKIAKVVMGL
jgi:ornithine--oxo-acid transaminase